MHRRTRLIAGVGAGVALAALAGCFPGDDPNEGLGGFGLPTAAPGDVEGTPVDLAGTMHVERNGCFTWTPDDAETATRLWVVWPASADDDGDHVRLGDGTRVTEGDRLEGRGVVGDAALVPEFENRDSWLGSFGRFCEAEASGVVVFDDVRAVGG